MNRHLVRKDCHPLDVRNESRMVHPDTEMHFVSEEVGYGVFAKKPIPHGTIVYVKDELEITLTGEQVGELTGALKDIVEKYAYIDSAGKYVVSWDNAKYVNHSCNFNTIRTGYGFEIAIRDIHSGEEITDDYGLFKLSSPMRINCGCRNCRGIVMPDDAGRYADQWDAIVAEALVHMQDVPQPLIQFMDTILPGNC
ncbi:MAG: SET domain-containing protein-lysine N-methyltransferase [Gammaproteobacteria bacterium]|nr:MAG: SET domain-containing protein-lysine N-methyltransferase [Gammaproteobacteria bacterium]